MAIPVVQLLGALLICVAASGAVVLVARRARRSGSRSGSPGLPVDVILWVYPRSGAPETNWGSLFNAASIEATVADMLHTGEITPADYRAAMEALAAADNASRPLAPPSAPQ